jgi:bifunctional DNA-binding transcriptional regulator/antitoxin component of YhaV-PrlF toxin-antitoxin module
MPQMINARIAANGRMVLPKAVRTALGAMVLVSSRFQSRAKR